MSASINVAVPTSRSGKTPQRPAQRPGGLRRLGEGASAEAKRLVSAILEVLAGVRTPTAAAQALSLSLPRYYQLEVRALHGMLAACEPRPQGRGMTSESALAALQRECEHWRRECTRQQALVRAAQRAIGLATPPVKTDGSKRRQRRPTARALKAVHGLREGAEPVPTATDGAG
ncbi:MAG TPA: hypothetical protein VGY66_11245 [Gemmataceae bacterium]|nr:hypothetical protein [Gemmataceae bacterium]